MTGALVPISGVARLGTSAPSSSVDANRARGTCSLKTASGKTYRFRTNPNSIRWKYQLNTHIEDTYGGRVIQILSARITQLSVEVEAGWGGWPYVVKTAYFLRDMMNEQRNGSPATFEYTTRNWKLKVFASSIPFTDTVGRPNRKINMTFNVVEDGGGALSSATIGAELKRLQEGIGYEKNKYNSRDSENPATAAINLLTNGIRDFANMFNDGQNPLTGEATNPTGGTAGGGLIGQLPGLGGF